MEDFVYERGFLFALLHPVGVSRKCAGQAGGNACKRKQNLDKPFYEAAPLLSVAVNPATIATP
jgi:hypothetical protein